MTIKGRARADCQTKSLVKRLRPREIAIIDHRDLDELAASALVGAQVRAVINCKPSISGRYPNTGPLALLEQGIPLFDSLERGLLSLPDGKVIEIRGNEVFDSERKVIIARGIRQTKKSIHAVMETGKKNLRQSLESFLDNTLFYANRERKLILDDLRMPATRTCLRGRHVLLVVRGKGYCEDLKAIGSYMREMKPVLVGVDGGADILLACGCRPDLIIGDMDSVSDAALLCGAELLVHAYPDGYAPGMRRLRSLRLGAGILPLPGTSEDAAMLLAYHAGAELIVAVGAHSNMIDFLDKGREGMGSTFLTRLKVGSILIDARGLSKLGSILVGDAEGKPCQGRM